MRFFSRNETGGLRALTTISAMNKEKIKSFIIQRNLSVKRKKTVKIIVLDEISTLAGTI